MVVSVAKPPPPKMEINQILKCDAFKKKVGIIKYDTSLCFPRKINLVFLATLMFLNHP